MAFDLTISGIRHARVRKRLVKLADRFACETWGDDTLGVAIGHLTDSEAQKLYGSLVRIAKKETLLLRDPQAGVQIDLDQPGPSPPAWTPAEPVDTAAFYVAVHKTLSTPFERMGYGRSQFGFARNVDGHLLQRIGFGFENDRTMALVDWAFTGNPKNGWPAPIRLVDYVVGSDDEALWPVPLRKPQWGWLPASNAQLASSLEHMERGFTEVVHPFLDSVNTIEKLVAAFEDGRMQGVAFNIKEGAPHPATELTFGYGGGTLQNMAVAYRHLNRVADGRRFAEAYIPAGEGDFLTEMRNEVVRLFADV